MKTFSLTVSTLPRGQSMEFLLLSSGRPDVCLLAMRLAFRAMISTLGIRHHGCLPDMYLLIALVVCAAGTTWKFHNPVMMCHLIANVLASDVRVHQFGKTVATPHLKHGVLPITITGMVRNIRWEIAGLCHAQHQDRPARMIQRRSCPWQGLRQSPASLGQTNATQLRVAKQAHLQKH